MRTRRRRAAFKHELNDLIRGASGGFLFGIPLIYTMEVWWIGASVTPPMMLAAIGIMLTLAFALNLTEGFRQTQATTAKEAIQDTASAVAIGLVTTALILIILRKITWQTQLHENLGKLIFESVPFALGVALANQFLQASDENGQRSQPLREAEKSRVLRRFFPKNNLNETAADIGATLIGALIIAFNIAPTEEVELLVASVRGGWLLAVVAVSLIVSYLIVFQANFTSQSQRQMQKGLFQSPLSETVMSYLVSLIAAALMLVFFQQISRATPWDLALRHVLILGLPATVGGAAGRLAL